MRSVQTFVLECPGCEEDLHRNLINLTDVNEIVVEFIDGMEFDCDKCGTHTYVEVNIHSE